VLPISFPCLCPILHPLDFPFSSSRSLTPGKRSTLSVSKLGSCLLRRPVLDLLRYYPARRYPRLSFCFCFCLKPSPLSMFSTTFPTLYFPPILSFSESLRHLFFVFFYNCSFPDHVASVRIRLPFTPRIVSARSPDFVTFSERSVPSSFLPSAFQLEMRLAFGYCSGLRGSTFPLAISHTPPPLVFVAPIAVKGIKVSLNPPPRR